MSVWTELLYRVQKVLKCPGSKLLDLIWRLFQSNVVLLNNVYFTLVNVDAAGPKRQTTELCRDPEWTFIGEIVVWTVDLLQQAASIWYLGDGGGSNPWLFVRHMKDVRGSWYVLYYGTSIDPSIGIWFPVLEISDNAPTLQCLKSLRDFNFIFSWL